MPKTSVSLRSENPIKSFLRKSITTMNNEFKSHALDTIEAIREHAQPILSAPYGDIDDAMEDAPSCALIWVNREGCYQVTECDCKWGMQQVRQLARGYYELCDLSLVAWRIRGFWETLGD